MAHTAQLKRLVIIGGGFAGIRVALDLARRKTPGLKITLISSKPHFEYYPTLYRVVTGRSALQVCIPLFEIFEGLNVEVIEDFITQVNLKDHVLSGGIGSPYAYDYLVLAPGAETGYFNIPGLPELSYGFKSIGEALKLRQHLHDTLTPSADSTTPQEKKVQAAHFMVIGGGPTGVEMSGELMQYAKKLARLHGSDQSMVTVDLIEAAPRLLPTMPADISNRVYDQLHRRGVNIFLNRTVIKEEVDELFLKDAQIKTNTVIWTAGVKTSRLIGLIEGLELDKRGRVVVDNHLQAKGHAHVYVLGDAASTLYAGLAQTADEDGAFVAQNIVHNLTKAKQTAYVPHRPIYAIPAGPGWAVVLWGETRIYGRIASLLRAAADFRYLLSILSPLKAWAVFSKHGVLSEDCPVCISETPAK